MPKLSDECGRLLGKESTYKFWKARAAEAYKGGELENALAAEAVAYTRHDNEAFFYFCKDIMGFRDVEAFHKRMIPTVTGLVDGKRRNVAYEPWRMGLVFRGSLKSTAGSGGLPCWRIAQSTVAHQWEECHARIVLGSEKIALTKQHVQLCKNAVGSERFIQRFGDHKPKKRDEGTWGNEMFRSRLMPAMYASPTVFNMSLSVDRTGFHATTAVLDDLQARASTYNIDQIERAWELYRLVFSILDPGSEVLVVGTTWHYNDVYARIEEETQQAILRNQTRVDAISPGDEPIFHITKIPAETLEAREFNKHTDLQKWVEFREVEGTPFKEEVIRTAAWNARFPLEKLDEIRRKQGEAIYAAQYLLNPVAEVDRTFLRKDCRYRDQASDEKLFANNHLIYIGGDPAWVSQESVKMREASSSANSAIISAAVDPALTVHILQIFRKKAAVPEFVDELWRLWGLYKAPMAIALQQYDYRHLIPEIKRKHKETGVMPKFVWVSSGGGREDRPGKDDRIRAKLSGLWAAHKILLPRGNPEAEQEFFDFPKGKRKDVLDALTNIVEVMTSPLPRSPDDPRRLEADALIDAVESGMAGRSEPDFKNAY